MTQKECIQAINDAASSCIHQMLDIEINVPSDMCDSEVYELIHSWASNGGNLSECAHHFLLWPRGQVKPGANKVQINLV